MSATEADTTVRAADAGDVPRLLELFAALADYERLRDELRADERSLREALFGERPAASALLAERGGETAGYALFFETFSSFRVSRGIWLEDLFVLPSHRTAGVGRALLAAVAACVPGDDGRLEWAALDWNELALGFYRGIGARPMDGWTSLRLDGDALARLAAESDDRR
ncbi:MAG TPA: GNAT family N-acetyltransferase [Solirubrobacteraceae bacterium]|nr:GNAT family N-acetyltransferase [Solirubrobacteraceae bacterium]